MWQIFSWLALPRDKENLPSAFQWARGHRGSSVKCLRRVFSSPRSAQPLAFSSRTGRMRLCFVWSRAGQLLKDIIERLDAVPGVRSASLMDNGLFGGGDSNSDIFVEGAKPKAVETPASRWDMVGPNFFSTTGIPILYGREIGPQDSGNSQRVGLLNQTAAHYYFGDANPVGTRIRVKTTEGPSDFVVIGVVGDSKNGSVR